MEKSVKHLFFLEKRKMLFRVPYRLYHCDAVCCFFHQNCSTAVEIFLDKMRKKDEVFIIVKNDFLLSTYAKSLLEEGKEHSDTSWTVRLLAKLLISIRQVSNCESYSWMELINTEHWNEIIHGVKTLSEFTFSESGIIVEKPNIALKCGQGSKKVLLLCSGGHRFNARMMMFC
ncbi:hypothetical protein DPMN_066495 [Dreissena polymorpha]|uniref:Uncharacterized protein n=1 Tax=Dreissena polymorpha TaxID=45954 RepID=A0A9D3YZ30_DREPO|nr:hypothetical protein DPMN_066495 [Dreissena polymorpha]